MLLHYWVLVILHWVEWMLVLWEKSVFWNCFLLIRPWACRQQFHFPDKVFLVLINPPSNFYCCWSFDLCPSQSYYGLWLLLNYLCSKVLRYNFLSVFCNYYSVQWFRIWNIFDLWIVFGKLKGSHFQVFCDYVSMAHIIWQLQIFWSILFYLLNSWDNEPEWTVGGGVQKLWLNERILLTLYRPHCIITG